MAGEGRGRAALKVVVFVAVLTVDGGQACWSVSAKILECIIMPRRQAEYNPSYIQSRETAWDGEDSEKTEYRQDFHLIILKMFYLSVPFFSGDDECKALRDNFLALSWILC